MVIFGNINIYIKILNIKMSKTIFEDKKLELLSMIGLFNQAKDNLYNEVKKYCQNKEIPLDDRWDIFCGADLGDHFSWITRYSPIVDEYIEEGYLNRYETIYIDDILEWYEEKVYEILEEELGEEPAQEQVEVYMREPLVEFKEDTMQKFIKSFNFDW